MLSPMKERNHSRSKEKRNFSIALPETLIADLKSIAQTETRSRNRQIEHFLAEEVKRWKAENNAAPARSKVIQFPSPQDWLTHSNS